MASNQGKIGRTVQESYADTTLITRRLFRAPNARRMVVPILVISLFAGFLLDFPNIGWNAVLLGLAVFAAPTLVAIGVTQPLAVALGGRMNLRRSALMGFLGLCMVVGFLLLSVLFFVALALVSVQTYADPVARVVLIGYGSVVYQRHVILEGSSSERARALPAAFVHTVLGAVALGVVRPLSIQEWILAALSALVFYGAALAFTSLVRRPFLRGFGVDGLSLLRYTLEQFTEQRGEGREEMEAFFEKIAVPAKVRVGAIGFRGSDRWKSVVVAPMAHPGPMGLIGGSDLPAKVATSLAGVADHVVVVHGPTTHDQNPASTAECERIAHGVRSILSTVAASREGGPPARATSGLATVRAQAFGDSVFIVATLAPNPSDDIDSATGFAAVQEARIAGAQEAVFADAHNCMDVGSGLTLFGSPASHDILDATRVAVSEAMRTPRGPIRVGVGDRRDFAAPEVGIGARGIQAVVVDAGGRRMAYVVFDGNNMVPGLRDEVRARIARVVDDAEVLTTDNHSVNLTFGGFNPVGLRFDRARLVDLAEAAVRDAVSRLGDAEAAVGADLVEMRIFGPETTSRLTTSVNATASIVRPAFLLTLALGYAAAVLWALVL